MGTIFMNSENSKISESHWLLLNLAHKINLKGNDKHQILVCTTHGHIKKSYKNNKIKISVPIWN